MVAKPLIRLPLFAALFLAMSAYAVLASAHSTMSAVSGGNGHLHDQASIRKVMASYNAALNGGKTADVLPLYTEDGIFMPPFSQSAVGKDAVRKAYDAVFKELSFHVKFDIAELVVMAPRWAYVRTNSAGTTDHHSTGKTTAEANQELFLLMKGGDGMWRIARYSFSPTDRPASE